MNRAETIKILAVLQLNYPDSFKDKTKETLDGIINLWQSIFAEDDYAYVNAAIIAHIASDTNRFMPPIGVIKAKLTGLSTAGNEMTELNAWRIVKKALSNSSYNSKQEFDKLPATIQKAIGGADMLKVWASIPIDELETVVQSNFMRSYRAKVKNEKEYAALPGSIKEFAATLTENSGFEHKFIEGR